MEERAIIPYRQQAKAKKPARKLGTIFRSVWSFFFPEQLSVSDSCLPRVLYEVLPQRLSSSALEAMTDRVTLLRRAGFPIALDLLKEQIPDGYIGKMSVWYEGLPECPRCWLLQQGYFDKTQPVSR